MTNARTQKLWIVNAISFILFSLLTLTGLINWLLLPKGYEAKGSLLVSLRHFLVEVHEWAALLFIVTIMVHIALHWGYVKANLKRYGIIK
jgi:cytochrome b subunit of formate dehydrogenase